MGLSGTSAKTWCWLRCWDGWKVQYGCFSGPAWPGLHPTLLGHLHVAALTSSQHGSMVPEEASQAGNSEATVPLRLNLTSYTMSCPLHGAGKVSPRPIQTPCECGLHKGMTPGSHGSLGAIFGHQLPHPHLVALLAGFPITHSFMSKCFLSTCESKKRGAFSSETVCHGATSSHSPMHSPLTLSLEVQLTVTSLAQMSFPGMLHVIEFPTISHHSGRWLEIQSQMTQLACPRGTKQNGAPVSPCPCWTGLSSRFIIFRAIFLRLVHGPVTSIRSGMRSLPKNGGPWDPLQMDRTRASWCQSWEPFLLTSSQVDLAVLERLRIGILGRLLSSSCTLGSGLQIPGDLGSS